MSPKLPWRPSLTIPCHDLLPPVPCLIALDRKPYHLLEIQPVPAGQWKDIDRAAYKQQFLWRESQKLWFPEPSDWEQRPVFFVVVPPIGGERMRGVARPWQRGILGWPVLPEHYAVCALCGELSPCSHYEAGVEEEEAARGATAKLERDLKVLPGCCWSCQEPVTHRQKAIRFEGENADLPGAPPPVFHLRAKCLGDAREYEDRWVALDPRRFKRLSCVGTAVYHVDGMECTEGARCPGDSARHSSESVNHRYYSDEFCVRCREARALRGV